MRTRGILNDGTVIAYAYGISIGEYGGLATWSHSGSWAGFRSHLVFFPGEDFGVVILSNLGSFDPGTRAYEIADIYLGDVLEAPLDSNTATGDRTESVHFTVPEPVLDSYAGTYRLGPGWYVTLRRADEGLRVQATNEGEYSTRAVSETEFRVDAFGASIHFIRNADGVVDEIRYRDIRAPRMETVDPTTIDFSDYAGIYASEELSAQYTVVVSEGGLVAQHYRHGSIPLTLAYGDEFTSATWYFSPVTFVRNSDGEINSLLVGRGRARNLRFTKAGDDR
jgi:hypothetical protein